MMSSDPPTEAEIHREDGSIPFGVPVARPISSGRFLLAGPPHPILLNDHSRKACAVDLLLYAAGLAIVVVLLLAAFVGLTTLGAFDAGVFESPAVMLWLSMGFGALAMSAAVALNRARGLRLAAVGLAWRRWMVDAPLGIATTAAAFGVMSAAVLALAVAWPAGYEALRKNPQRFLEQMPEMTPLTLVVLSAFVGVWEEVVFRGFLLPRLRRLTGSWILAVVISSAVFAVLHLKMQVSSIVVPLFCLGSLFCVVTIWRRSILPAVIGHFLFDLVSLLAMTNQLPDIA